MDTTITMADLPKVTNSSIGNGTEIGDISIIKDSNIGIDCKIWNFVNIYGATIGDKCMIGSLVEIQSNVTIGDRSRIQSHAFICSKVHIKSNVFVGHGAKFINDVNPPSESPSEWERTTVEDDVVIGTNATLLPVKIGENALIGAGSVVVDDVPTNAIVAGNPAEIIGYRQSE